MTERPPGESGWLPPGESGWQPQRPEHTPPPSYGAPPGPPQDGAPSAAPYSAWQAVPAGPPPSSSGRGAVIVLAVMGACLVLAAALAIPLVLGMGSGDDDAPSRAQPVTLDEVRAYDDLSAAHLDGRIDYDLAPPAGGEHNDRWLACGIYETEIPDEFAVHSLEHGTVWITHDPDLAAEDIAILQELLPEDGIMSPYRGQPAPVVVTVWGRQLHLDGATDPRLELFIDKYGDGHTSLEPFVTCHGGIGLEEARRLLGGQQI